MVFAWVAHYLKTKTPFSQTNENKCLFLLLLLLLLLLLFPLSCACGNTSTAIPKTTARNTWPSMVASVPTSPPYGLASFLPSLPLSLSLSLSSSDAVVWYFYYYFGCRTRVIFVSYPCHNGVIFAISCHNFLKINRIVVSYLYWYVSSCLCPCILDF